MLTRRKLALSALAPAALAAQSPYQGALAAHPQLNQRDFDSLEYTLRRYAEMPRRLAFRARELKAAQAWQKRLRAKLAELTGYRPHSTALAPKLVDSTDFPTYRRETIAFTAEPGLDVFGYLLIPKNSRQPLPVVISIPGHGRGVDDIVGIDENGRPRTVKPPYAYDYAVQIVEHGMAAFAIEPLGFGCRRDARARAASPTTASCQPSAGAALLFGETIIGWRCADISRSIDYLATRPEFDPRRVGLMGISGGGMATAFGAALDTRIAAAFISGYLNTFKDSILSLSHCIDNYVPGILQWCEQSDISALIAPRPLFCESGEHDPIFPVAAFRSAVNDLEKVYSVFGAKEHFASTVHPGAHVFDGRQGLPFLAKHLA